MPLAVMAVITIGTQIAAAKIKSNAAKKANEAQLEGANKALDVQKTQKDEAMQRLEPFASGQHSMAALLGGAQTPYSTIAPYVGPGAGGVGGQPTSNVSQYNDAGMGRGQVPPWMMPRGTATPGGPPGGYPPPSGVTPPDSGYAVPLQTGAQSNPPPGMNYRYQPNGPPVPGGAQANMQPPAMPRPMAMPYQPQYLGNVMA